MNLDPHFLLQMGVGYLITIAIETVVLLIGLSKQHPIARRLFAGVWLTACTYPVVWLVLPEWLLDNLGWDRLWYLVCAETFAPLAECFIFWLAFQSQLEKRVVTVRDYLSIIIANLLSFVIGGQMIDFLDMS